MNVLKRIASWWRRKKIKFLMGYASGRIVGGSPRVAKRAARRGHEPLTMDGIVRLQQARNEMMMRGLMADAQRRQDAFVKTFAVPDPELDAFTRDTLRHVSDAFVIPESVLRDPEPFDGGGGSFGGGGASSDYGDSGSDDSSGGGSSND